MKDLEIELVTSSGESHIFYVEASDHIIIYLDEREPGISEVVSTGRKF